MTIYTKTVAGIESTATTPFLSLINWFCDQVEASRPESRRDDPINCGRDEFEFLVMLIGMIERLWRISPDVDTEQPLDKQYMDVLEFLHQHGDITTLVVD